MAKKTLNEAVVRRFQKLANVVPMNEMYNMREEEEDADFGEEVPVEDEAPVEDDAMELTPDDMDGEAGTVEVGEEEILSAKQGLEAALQVFNQILPSAGEEDADEAPDFDAEEAPAPDAEADADADLGMDDELMEALRDISYKPSKNEVVNEVAKRVAKRLKSAKLHETKLNRALGRK